MDSEKYSLKQNIFSKRDEISTLERDLASKKADLAELEAKYAAGESRATVKFVDDVNTTEKTKEKK